MFKTESVTQAHSDTHLHKRGGMIRGRTSPQTRPVVSPLFPPCVSYSKVPRDVSCGWDSTVVLARSVPLVQLLDPVVER